MKNENKNIEHDYMPTMFIWGFIYLFVMYIISAVFNLSNTVSILLGLPFIIICGGYSIAFILYPQYTRYFSKSHRSFFIEYNKLNSNYIAVNI